MLGHLCSLLQLPAAIAILPFNQITHALNKHLPRLKTLIWDIQLLNPVDLVLSLVKITILDGHLQHISQCFRCHLCIFCI